MINLIWPQVFKPNHKINKMCEYFAKTDKDKNKDNDDKDASKD